jgi:translation initiation factor 1
VSRLRPGKIKKNGLRSDTPIADGIVRLHRQTSGRKGKGVTLIKGLMIPDAEIATLAKTLKSSCGVGGAVKSGVIELQTAEREKVKALLDAAGFTVKIAGG